MTFTRRVVSGVFGENRRIFGGPERQLGIVVTSTLKSGGPMGEVDLERSLDGGWSCLELVAVRAVKEPYDDGTCGSVGCTVPQHINRFIGALSRRPGPVPFVAQSPFAMEPTSVSVEVAGTLYSSVRPWTVRPTMPNE